MVTTERAKHFYSPQEIPVPLYSDEDEWQVSSSTSGEGKGSPSVPTSPVFCDSGRFIMHLGLLLPAVTNGSCFSRRQDSQRFHSVVQVLNSKSSTFLHQRPHSLDSWPRLTSLLECSGAGLSEGWARQPRLYQRPLYRPSGLAAGAVGRSGLSPPWAQQLSAALRGASGNVKKATAKWW